MVIVFTVIFLILLLAMILHFVLQDRQIVITRKSEGVRKRKEGNSGKIESWGKNRIHTSLTVRPEGYEKTK